MRTYTDMEDLAKNIKSLRRQKGWSQNDFATRLGISVPAFSKIENGITDLHLSRVSSIADVLDISLTELLFDNQELAINETSELSLSKTTIIAYKERILDLQKQVILLHEEIRRINSSNKIA